MRKRLVEKFDKDWSMQGIKPIIVPLTETTRIVEGINGEKYSCLSCYKIPIWKLGLKNCNGRIYPLVLGEKIVQENKVTVALDSHPEDDNYVPVIKDVIAIGKNPEIIDGILYASCYFVDAEVDAKVHRMLDLGFALQQSSSGLGEVDYNDTVISDTYELERYFDLLVQDSSYQVYTSKENEVLEPKTVRVEKNEDPIRESIEKVDISEKKTLIEKKVTISNITNKRNDVMAENKSLKLNVKSLIREANTESNLAKKNNLYKEAFAAIKDEADFVDMRKDLVEKIKSVDNQLATLAEKGKSVDTVKGKLSEANTKLSEATGDISKLKAERSVFLGKIKESAEKLTKVSETAKTIAKKYKEAQAKFVESNKKNKVAYTKVRKIAESNGKMIKKSVVAVSLIKEKFNALEFKNEALTRKNERLIKENAQLAREARGNGRSSKTENRDRSNRDSRPVLNRRPVRENIERSRPEPKKDDYKQTDEVRRYYEDTVRSKPQLRNFKEQICGSKTVEDAMFRVMKYEADSFDNSKLKANLLSEKIAKIDDGAEIKNALESSVLAKRTGWV